MRMTRLRRAAGCRGCAVIASMLLPGVACAATPFLSFGAQRSEVPSGESTRLSWASLGAQTCVASGAWSGAQPESGTFETAPLVTGAGFTLTCTGDGGTVERRVFVDVVGGAGGSDAPELPAAPAGNEGPTVTTEAPAATPPAAAGQVPAAATQAPAATTEAPAPDPAVATSMTLAALPSTVEYGGATTVSWTATGASKCIASGAWAGTKAPSGTETRVNLQGESRFALTCMGARGVQSREVAVAVGVPEPVSVDLSSVTATVEANQATTLVWTAKGASTCTASGAWDGAKDVRGTHSTGPLTASGTFAITCSGPGGTASDSVAVTVVPEGTAAVASMSLPE